MDNARIATCRHDPMELNSEIPTAPPRDASTVMMLRDGQEGLEVFLVKRHGLSDVLGGAYVFPGGKLDGDDQSAALAPFLDQDVASLHAALTEPDTAPAVAAGLFVAALREAFEESGVLFAEGATLEHSLRAAQWVRDGQPFNQVLATMSLKLQTRRVVPWSRWITPRMPSVTNKRFDTRFFVAALPADQVAVHDSVETVKSVWISPRQALEQYWERAIEMAPPQIMSLAHLARYPDVASALQAARSAAAPLILPEAFDVQGERMICYPGDPQHSVAHRAMPGPTRLFFRNRRFEPEGGFEALIA